MAPSCGTLLRGALPRETRDMFRDTRASRDMFRSWGHKGYIFGTRVTRDMIRDTTERDKEHV